MMPTIKSEVRKLLSVRSTYIILGLALALSIIVSFYLMSWKARPETLSVTSVLAGQVGTFNIFVGLMIILLVTHEYRYNTIIYTITATQSRTRALVAKYLAISCFAILFTLFFSFLAIGLIELAALAHNLSIRYYDFVSIDSLWRLMYAGWGFASLTFMLAMIIRSQVGAIVALLLVPNAVELLLSTLFKINPEYLPFGALNVLLDSPGGHISYVRATLVSGIYMAIGWIIVWLLFLRRDAN